MSSQSFRNDDSQRPFRSGDSTSRRVLEDVIKQTSALYAEEPQTDPHDLEPLLEVARRFKGAEFQLEPVLLEMVRATLRRQAKMIGQTEEQLAAVADRTARTLFENPESHARLNALWQRLSAVN